MKTSNPSRSSDSQRQVHPQADAANPVTAGDPPLADAANQGQPADSTDQTPATPTPSPGVGSVSPAEAMSLALPPPQRAAITMLTSGHSLVDSATAAGVNRTTLYRWLNTDANFKAAYNAWQHDAIATARGKLIALTDAAIKTVSRALNNGDAKTALVILKSTGILDRPEPGSTDPEEVRQRQEMEKTKAEMQLFKDQLGAKFGQ